MVEPLDAAMPESCPRLQVLSITSDSKVVFLLTLVWFYFCPLPPESPDLHTSWSLPPAEFYKWGEDDTRGAQV